MATTLTTEPDVERVRVVYEDVHVRLWRALVAFSGSTDVADEAVAESFAQLLRRGAAVRDPAAWVWRSAFRIAAGELKRWREGAGERSVPEVGFEMPEPAFDLVEALSALSEQQRASVVLCDVVGHTAPEAARLLGTSAATVRVQLMRARRRLREALGGLG